MGDLKGEEMKEEKKGKKEKNVVSEQQVIMLTQDVNSLIIEISSQINQIDDEGIESREVIAQTHGEPSSIQAVRDLKEDLEKCRQKYSDDLGAASQNPDKANKARLKYVKGCYDALYKHQSSIMAAHTLSDQFKSRINAFFEKYFGRKKPVFDIVKQSIFISDRSNLKGAFFKAKDLGKTKSETEEVKQVNLHTGQAGGEELEEEPQRSPTDSKRQ